MTAWLFPMVGPGGRIESALCQLYYPQMAAISRGPRRAWFGMVDGNLPVLPRPVFRNTRDRETRRLCGTGSSPDRPGDKSQAAARRQGLGACRAFQLCL